MTTSIINRIKLAINHILKNNKVINIGIVIHIGDNHIRCLNILIQVNKNGIINNI